jgi:hypothetical protein
MYVDHAREPERFRDYLERFVLGCGDHWQYLDKLGGLRRMEELKADRILGY